MITQIEPMNRSQPWLPAWSWRLGLGVALLLGSVLAGSLWAGFGPPATFIAGGAFAGIALIGMLSWQDDSK